MATGYVRPARPGEAAEIARIQLATWRTAYRRLLPRKILDELDEGWTADRWYEAIVTPPTAHHRVLVAVEQTGAVERAGSESTRTTTEATTEAASAYLVGFAATGPADEAALAPGETADTLGSTVAAVTELLVEPRWGRRGHGSRLLAACVAGWRADGYSAAVAWAFAEDRVTRGFFESAGWAPDGASRALDIDDLLVPQLRLHTSLTEEPPSNP